VHGRVVVLPLFTSDVVDRRHSLGVNAAKGDPLCIEVAENDLFHGNRRSSDGTSSEWRRRNTERRSTDGTQPVAAAATDTAAREFCSKHGAVPFLVRLAFRQFRDKRGCHKTRYPSLTPVDADRTLLAGVIDLHDPVAERFSWLQSRHQNHCLFLPPHAGQHSGRNELPAD
jgi:hypothetical protein